MSATGRGSKRQPQDFYQTPAWCVWRLVERVYLPHGRWLEPAAGAGNITRAVNDMRRSSKLIPSWQAIEIDPRHKDALTNLVGPSQVRIADFLGDDPIPAFDVLITNPPYSLAEEFIKRALDAAHPYAFVAMLLRLNFAASAKRWDLMHDSPPSVYVLPNRPSFVNGRTDATEYAWFVWGAHVGTRTGYFEVLNTTPASDRNPKPKGRP